MSHTHYCVVGDVTVDASAAIAPGVVLQASPGSRIVIQGRACLAGGVCIQSRNGILTIGAGASLGANVLVVGCGSVGAGACISAGSTLMNPQLEADALTRPGAVVGALASNAASATAGGQSSVGSSFNSGISGSHSFANNEFVAPPPVGPRPIAVPDLSGQNGTYVDPTGHQEPSNSVYGQPASANGSYTNGSYTNGAYSNGVQLNNSTGDGGVSHQGASPQTNASADDSSALTLHSNNRVYGKDQVNQLISTLFPNRQSL